MLFMCSLRQWPPRGSPGRATAKRPPRPPSLTIPNNGSRFPASAAGRDGREAPSDAIVLFDGRNLDEWVMAKDRSPARWRVEKGTLVVDKAFGNIETKRLFKDYQLHLEWRIPANVTGEGQGRGNSGLFLASTGTGDQGYEVQILDSWENKTYVNGHGRASTNRTLRWSMRPQTGGVAKLRCGLDSAGVSVRRNAGYAGLRHRVPQRRPGSESFPPTGRDSLHWQAGLSKYDRAAIMPQAHGIQALRSVFAIFGFVN